jgi:NAD(P)-dependent dehydrogenase (short-subunit alcohol dehydrogenase family)
MQNQGSVIITGSGGGIGLSIAKYFLENGASNIVCQYRKRNEDLFKLFKSYQLDPEEYCIGVELTDEEDIQKFREFAEKKNDKIWALINVAGASTSGMSWKLTKKDFEYVVNSNLLATFLCTKAFIPTMRNRGEGRVVNFSSVVAFTGTIGAVHYCAAKAGIVGLTKGLAVELANKNITVNAVALGYFNAGLIKDVPVEMQSELIRRTPMMRLGDTREVAKLVDYLISKESGFTTGQIFHINGGLY